MATIINASTSSGLIQTADTSGILQLQSNGTTIQTIDSTGSYGQLKQSTVIPTTSGTGPFSFINIPTWAKRITVMFSGVSASASNLLVQIGSGSYSSSGYVSAGISAGATNSQITTTAGFYGSTTLSTGTNSGIIVLTNITGNTWAGTTTAARSDGVTVVTSGFLALGGVLDRVQVTTISGTATFSAGNINILYEG
jgi:hypothetical protein